MNDGNANDTRVNIAKHCEPLVSSLECQTKAAWLDSLAGMVWRCWAIGLYADSICLWFYSMNMNGFVCNHLYGTDFTQKKETIA